MAIFATFNAQGQTFLGNLRKVEQGKGMVTIVQSQEITDLVNGTQKEPEHITLKPDQPEHSATTTGQQPTHNNSTAATQQPTHSNTTPQQPTHSNTTPQQPAHGNTTAQQHTTHETPADTPSSDEQPVDTRKKVMRKSYKTTGYRVQVFSGGNSRSDRMKAETAGTTMKSNFPNEPVYVHFYSPSWKCRMGNYKSMDEARRILRQVKALGYSQACIVKGQISVQY